MCSSEFLQFNVTRLWAQDIPCLCYHPCPAHMSHLPPSCLLYITDALTSPLCINFFLLLTGTLEVTACSSSTDGIGFTSVVVRTILPLAQPHALPSLQSGQAWSGLFPQAGWLTCVWQEQTEGRSMSMGKVPHWTRQQATPTPTKPRQMAGIFSSRGKQQASLLSPLSFILEKTNFTAGFSSA